jgi:hypothetical protein
MELPKHFRGDKYIYLLMAYKLASETKDKRVKIGNDNGLVGGQNYERIFTIRDYDGHSIIQETKSSKAFADFSKFYEIVNPNDNRPVIKEYIDESGDNCSIVWVH